MPPCTSTMHHQHEHWGNSDSVYPKSLAKTSTSLPNKPKKHWKLHCFSFSAPPPPKKKKKYQWSFEFLHFLLDFKHLGRNEGKCTIIQLLTRTSIQKKMQQISSKPPPRTTPWGREITKNCNLREMTWTAQVKWRGMHGFGSSPQRWTHDTYWEYIYILWSTYLDFF